MTACAALLILFGIFTFTREGWSWFSALWLAAGLFLLVLFVRLAFISSASKAGDDREKAVQKPSKPMAVFSAVAGVGFIIFGIVMFGRTDPFFIVVWVAFGLLIVGGQLWSAFGRSR